MRAVVVALAVVLIGWVPVGYADDADIDSLDPSVESAPTLAAASMEAAAIDEPVLAESLLTETSAVFAMPDGSRVAEVYAGPVRVEDDTALTGWVPLDLNLEASAGGFVPAASAADVKLSDGGLDGEVARLNLAGGASVAWRSDVLLPPPLISGNVATYPDVYPGIDLQAAALDRGVELSWVVRVRPVAPVVLRLPLRTVGVSVRSSAEFPGGYEFVVGASGEVIGTAAPPLMWDSAFDPMTGRDQNASSVPTTIETDASGQSVLELRPDPAWLANPGVVFPVTIDPPLEVTYQETGTNDTNTRTIETFVTDKSLETSTSHDGLGFKVGTNSTNNKTRGLIAFRNDATGSMGPINGNVVEEATIYLNETFHGGGSTAEYFYKVSSGGINETKTWDSWTAHQPPVDNDFYASKVYPSTLGSHWVKADGTASPGAHTSLAQLAQEWALGTPNLGILMKAANEADTNSRRHFSDSEDSAPGNRPKMVVSYHALAAPAMSSVPYPNQAAWYTSGAGTVTGSLSGNVDATSASGNWVIDYRVGTSGTVVSSGANPTTFTTPPLGLTTGTWTIQMRMRKTTGALASVVSGWTSYVVHVDTGAPAVSVTAPAASSWWSSDNGVVVQGAVTGGGASGVTVYIAADAVAGTVPGPGTPGVVTAAAGALSVPLSTLPSGGAYIHVRAVAGNGAQAQVNRFVNTAPSAPFNSSVSTVPTDVGVMRVVNIPAAQAVLVRASGLPVDDGSVELLDPITLDTLDAAEAQDDGSEALGTATSLPAGWQPVEIYGTSVTAVTWRIASVAAATSAALPLGGAAVPVNLTTAAAEARLTLAVGTKQSVTLTSTSGTLPSGTIELVDDVGSVVGSATIAAGAADAKFDLPAAGTYTAIVRGAEADTGSASISATAVPPPVITAGAAATPITITTTAADAGRQISVAAGQPISMVVTNPTSNAEVTLVDDSGELIGTFEPGDDEPIVNEEVASGSSVTALVSSNNSVPASATVAVYAIPDPSAVPLPTTGTTATASVTTPGQTAEFLITTVARQHLSLAITAAPGGVGTLSVRNAVDADEVAGIDVPLTVGSLAPDIVLPAAGAYRVVIDPPGAFTGPIGVSAQAFAASASLAAASDGVALEAGAAGTWETVDASASGAITVVADKASTTLSVKDAAGNPISGAPTSVSPGTPVVLPVAAARVSAVNTTAANATISVARGGTGTAAAALDRLLIPGEFTTALAQSTDSDADSIGGSALSANDGTFAIRAPTASGNPLEFNTSVGTAELLLPNASVTAKRLADGVVSYDSTSLHYSTTVQVDAHAGEDMLARIAVVAYDSAAPRTFTFPAPTGTSVVLNSDGGAGLADAAGNTVLTIDAPWGSDTTGAAVSTSYASNGQNVVITLPATLTAAQFPVSVVLSAKKPPPPPPSTISVGYDDLTSTPAGTDLLDLYRPALIFNRDPRYPEQYKPINIDNYIINAYYKSSAGAKPVVVGTISRLPRNVSGGHLSLIREKPKQPPEKPEYNDLCPQRQAFWGTCRKYAPQPALLKEFGVYQPTAHPAYGYERVLRKGVSPNTVHTYLQYWYFYYHNGWINRKNVVTGEVGLTQSHAGDWEVTTIHLVNGAPTQVGFSAHVGGNVWPWSNVRKLTNPANRDDKSIRTHVKVYVASGSHANYKTGGIKDLPDVTVPLPAMDPFTLLTVPYTASNFRAAVGVRDHAAAGVNASVFYNPYRGAIRGLPLDDDATVVRYAGLWGASEHVYACGHPKKLGWSCLFGGRIGGGPDPLPDPNSHPVYAKPSAPFNGAWKVH